MALAVSGCSRSDLYEDTLIVTDKPQVAEVELHQDHYPGVDLSENAVYSIMDKYDSLSAPKLHLTVVHCPSRNSSTDADLKRLTKKLNALGVDNISIDKVPVAGVKTQVLVDYEGLELSEAAQCKGKNMPGMHDNQPGNDRDYLLGCELQRQVLAQIAYPEDALGHAGLSEGQSAARAASAIKGHHSAEEPLEFVPGYTLSDIGQSSE